LFFVLSGFLIVDILRRQREKIENSGSTFLREWKRFVFRRAYRIFPVYFLFLAIIIPVATILGNQGIDIKAVIMHIFYLVNIWVNFVFRHWNQTTTHLWSLSVEEQFYVLFPILALKTPSNKLPIIFLVIIILWLVTRAFFFVTRTWLAVFSSICKSHPS
jgi:peptidoglycan/LPS O-acetylase OafA/YrhL